MLLRALFLLEREVRIDGELYEELRVFLNTITIVFVGLYRCFHS